MAEKQVWGIHAGRLGEAHSLFLKQNVIAIGWSEMGDLSRLSPNRDAFKEKVASTYPTAKPGAIPNNAGQLFRFVHEIKKGDLVVFPSKTDKQIHVGKIEGDYKYQPNIDGHYPNARSVTWLKHFPRTNFSQGALYETGSAMSFFLVKTYAEEFVKALEGKVTSEPVSHDETVEFVVADIEQTTKDFLLKTLAQDFKGHPLAHFFGHLLEAMGYRVKVAPEGPDGGIDIVAHRDEFGFESPIKVQVKSNDGNVGDPAVSALFGKLGKDDHGIIVTLGDFTKQARDFSKSKTNLRLIEGEELVGLILSHYEKLNAHYKSLIPLKRVYVPEPKTEESE